MSTTTTTVPPLPNHSPIQCDTENYPIDIIDQQDEFLAQQLAACYWEADHPETTGTFETIHSNHRLTVRSSSSSAAATNTNTNTNTATTNSNTNTTTTRTTLTKYTNWNRWQWIVGTFLAMGLIAFILYWLIKIKTNTNAFNRNHTNNEKGTIHIVPIQQQYTTFQVEFDNTMVTLERSTTDSNIFYTLAQVVKPTMSPNSNHNKNDSDDISGTVGGNGVVPLARTYDGYGWERSGGPIAAQMMEWVCEDDTYPNCTNTFNQGTYFVQQRQPDTVVREIMVGHSIARFLEQSTFGVTMELLQQLTNATNTTTTSETTYNTSTTTTLLTSRYIQFLQQQITNIPPTYLREFFRRRVNAPTNSHKPEFASQTNSCTQYSYWQHTLFSVRDRDAMISLQNVNETKLIVRVAGLIRSIFSYGLLLEGLPIVWEGNYSYCGTNDRTRRGEYKLIVQDACRRLEQDLVISFPPNDIDSTTLLELEKASILKDLPALSNQTFWQRHFTSTNHFAADYQILEPISADACMNTDGPVFAQTVNNEWLLFAPRLLLHENSLDAPLIDGGANALDAGTVTSCANVPRTLFNQDTCVLATSACPAASSNPNRDNSVVVDTTNNVIVCGSPGEVQNNATAGDHWMEISSLPPSRANADNTRVTDTADSYDLARQREFVWASVVFEAKDQVRQRVAWALSQIFALAKTSIRGESYQTESFLAFYDILVKHAFGNYLDILREISYNPLMAENLSFLNSQSLISFYTQDGVVSHPDENYARELMQLFTIGLDPLQLDGSLVLDPKVGNTYTNHDVMSFARVWTGFEQQALRANVESPFGTNTVDPLRIDPIRRDHFPKTNLYGGYIGDGYPLCTNLPSKIFLRRGATYRLLGGTSVPELLWTNEDTVEGDSTKRLRLQPTSDLYQLLCSPNANNLCTFPSLVMLDKSFSYCDDQNAFDECLVEMVRVVQVEQLFYEYIPPPCVQLAFYESGKEAIRADDGSEGVCGNPQLSIASEACCAVADPSLAFPACIYSGERMTMSAAQDRCISINSTLCTDASVLQVSDKCPHQGLIWTTRDCQVRIKVRADGYVAIFHHLVDNAALQNLRIDSPAYFQIFWNNGTYPSVAGNSCGNGICETYDVNTCTCEVSVKEYPVFLSTPRDGQEILALLRVGYPEPSVFVDDSYRSYQEKDFIYYSSNSSCCGVDTVFEVQKRIGQTQYLRNVESTVTIESFASFRNPPHFNSFFIPYEASVSDAQYETDALLQHLFMHSNTAPFVATRMIQRFGVSNPSPRYVKAAATAFHDGKYTVDDTVFGTEKYGDIQALVAAILLDREARSLALTADSAHGALKEPILIVMGFLRAMQFKVTTPMLELHDMDNKIGQMAFEQNSVFSFFSPMYSPPGPLSSSSLAAPESQIMSSTRVIGLLNGLLGLVQYGLVSCRQGFGANGACKSVLPADQPSGHLTYDPRNFNDSATIVEELSTLLTSGRLSHERTLAIRQYFEDERDPVVGLWLALQLIITSPEFHSTSYTETKGDPVVLPDDVDTSDDGPKYKAVIHLALIGGCDSYNVLVPYTTCTKLYNEYKDVRESVALGPEKMLPIVGETTNQPCDEFGLHNKLPFLKDLYDKGELLFLANTGILTEMVDRDNFSDLTLARLFAHDAMQDEVNKLDPLNDVIGTGILGRMADILQQNGFRTERIVVDGIPTSLAGRSSSPIVTLNSQGVSSLNLESPDRPLLEEFIQKVGNGDDESGTLGSLWSTILQQSFGQTGDLVKLLEETTNENEFRQDTSLGRDFRLMSELIRSHKERRIDRDVFFVTMQGFDSHSDLADTLDDRFQELNAAIEDFESNLKAAGLWESVVIVQTSEFARTLSPNSGEGTDHAWGGNYWVAGGAVLGGRILGQYPETFASGHILEAGQRGRLIPTTSWDSVFNGIMLWMGENKTSEEQLDYVLPNRKRFSKLYNEHDLFSPSKGT